MNKSNKIIKIIKAKTSKEVFLSWYYDGKNFNPSINKKDKIIFICEKCDKISSRRRNEFEKHKYFLCGNCSRKQTNLKKYGVFAPACNKEIQEKIKQTKLEKYGDKNYTNQEKREQTNLKKYEVKNISEKKEIKTKKKETFLKKFGGFTFESKNLLRKVKQTKLERYGDENYNNREKYKKTLLERYGVENPQQLKKIKNITLKEHKKTIFKRLINNLKENNLTPVFDLIDYNGIDINNKYSFQCNVCNTVFEDHLDNGRIPRCPICFPKYKSLGEQELADFISQHIEIIENDRELIKPYEIDILIPELKLGIEYNGDYWHTEEFGRDDNYHQMKIDKMKEADYDLIYIWESDWNLNKEEIKNDLLEVLK